MSKTTQKALETFLNSLVFQRENGVLIAKPKEQADPNGRRIREQNVFPRLAHKITRQFWEPEFIWQQRKRNTISEWKDCEDIEISELPDEVSFYAVSSYKDSSARVNPDTAAPPSEGTPKDGGRKAH